MSAVATFAILVLALVVVVVGVLAIPIQVAMSGVFAEHQVDAAAQARWAFGAVSVRAGQDGVVVWLGNWSIHRHYRRDRPTDDTEEKNKKKNKKKKKRWRPGWRFMWRVGRRLLASLRLRSWVTGRLGTGDPADTAKVFGLLTAGRALLPGLDTRGIQIDWIEPVVDLEGHIEGRIWPLAIAWIAVSELVRTR